MLIKTDCRFFRGDIPCKPNKEQNAQCETCNYYEATSKKILIIKIGAIGDVIRTTPILHRIKEKHPNSLIYWITNVPEILPDQYVDYKLKFNFRSILIIEETEFDIVCNLDKDWEACALTNKIKSKAKKGFYLLNGKPYPINNNSFHKYILVFLMKLVKKIQKIICKKFLKFVI